VGYPDSSSFTGFLIKNYGLEKFKQLYIFERRKLAYKKKEPSLNKVYDKSLKDLEKEWLFWLEDKYNIEEKHIQNLIKK